MSNFKARSFLHFLNGKSQDYFWMKTDRRKLFSIHQFRKNLQAKFFILYSDNVSADWEATKLWVHRVTQYEYKLKFTKVERNRIKFVLKKSRFQKAVLPDFCSEIMFCSSRHPCINSFSAYVYRSMTYKLLKINFSKCIVRCLDHTFINDYFAEQLLKAVSFSRLIFHQVVDANLHTQVKKYFLISLIQMENCKQSC